MSSNFSHMADLSERELLFNAYLDDELSGQERERFDARLRQDEAFRREYDAFAEVVGGLRQMPFEFASDDFVDKVQRRIRTRSQGRFFAEKFLTSSRIPYEVVAVVMIAVMAAAYLMMEAPRDQQIEDVAGVEEVEP